jgi:membrane-associated protease RseP (regulator of RpoE activity)
MTALVYALGVVLFFLGVVVSIALHEVGHMWPAKKFGIKVTQYFVGFGKTVWSVKRGDTEYGVKMFPMGGFIKMVGMLPPERRNPDGSVRGFRRGFFGKLISDARALEYEHVTAADEDRLFYRKPWWKKVIVMSGGPLMNVFLAVVILGGVFIGLGVPEPTLQVQGVEDCVIPASQAGRACRPTDPAAPALRAHFRSGDTILAVDGVRMRSWDQFSRVTRDSVGKTMHVAVRRDGHRVTLTAHPIRNQLTRPTNVTQYVNAGFLGIYPSQVRERQGIGFVFSTIGDYSARTGQALLTLPQRMVGVGKAALGLQKRDPSSPMSVVGASRVAGEVASDSSISLTDRWATLLQLLGVVNLFVALFNFIPLLPLDGGHIAGALYEALRRAWARARRRPDPGYADVAQMLPVAYAAASVLIVMGVLLVWADIVNPIRLSG